MAANFGKERSNSTDDPYVVYKGCLHRIFRVAGESLSSLLNEVKGTAVKLIGPGRSDPRKVVFAAKMGASLSLVSLLIFFKGPSDYISKYSIWAILTVVVVFEFSIGATLSKGFNRALGTFSAGALALGIAQLSIMAGKWQGVVIVINIFIAGFLASYFKLHPAMKQYEYGFRVFLLTFCIVLISGNSNYLQTAVSRLLFIATGACTCLIVNSCIYPIWAGEDLHTLVAKNFNGVASSLEGCVNMYLQCIEYSRIPSKILIYQASDDPLYKGYRAAIQSTSQEETLLSFAIWEPHYNMCKYPWSEYVKVSGALRHCAFMVMAMHGCILSEIQASSELRQAFKDRIQKVGIDGAKVLRHLGDKLEKMEKLSPTDLLQDVHDAAEDLQMMIDQKSYLLVNADNWDGARRSEKFLDPDQIQELKDNAHKPVVINSLSDVAELRNSSVTQSVSQWGSGEDLLRNEKMWPSRLSVIGDTILNEREVKMYESATALSLATFTSLLIDLLPDCRIWLTRLRNSARRLSLGRSHELVCLNMDHAI